MSGGGPGYWMYETSGVLRPAVDAYLNNREMTVAQIAALRAYIKQWIMAPIWDANPHAGAEGRVWLANMRDRVDYLVSRQAITRWLDDALEGGIDPL